MIKRIIFFLCMIVSLKLLSCSSLANNRQGNFFYDLYNGEISQSKLMKAEKILNGLLKLKEDEMVEHLLNIMSYCEMKSKNKNAVSDILDKFFNRLNDDTIIKIGRGIALSGLKGGFKKKVLYDILFSKHALSSDTSGLSFFSGLLGKRKLRLRMVEELISLIKTNKQIYERYSYYVINNVLLLYFISQPSSGEIYYVPDTPEYKAMVSLSIELYNAIGQKEYSGFFDINLFRFPTSEAINILMMYGKQRNLPIISGATYYNLDDDRWLKMWQKLEPEYKYIPLKFRYFLKFDENRLKFATRLIFHTPYLHLEAFQRHPNSLKKFPFYRRDYFEGINVYDPNAVIAWRFSWGLKSRFDKRPDSRAINRYYLAAYDYQNRIRSVRYIQRSTNPAEYMGYTIYTWNIYYSSNGKPNRITKHDAEGNLVYDRVIR